MGQDPSPYSFTFWLGHSSHSTALTPHAVEKAAGYSSVLLSARSRLSSRTSLSDVPKGKALWPEARLQCKARIIHWKEWKCAGGADISTRPGPLSSYSAHGKFMNVAFYLSNHISPVPSPFHCKPCFQQHSILGCVTGLTQEQLEDFHSKTNASCLGLPSR